MLIRRAYVLAVIAALAVACGGSVFNTGDGGGSGSSGAAGAATGGHSSAGASTQGGTTGRAGAASGGTMAVAGSMSMAGAPTSGGGPNCQLVDCAYPVCPDGSQPATPPGQCCPVCGPPSNGCQGVTCETVKECGVGYELGRPAGACCTGCVPKPGGVACPKIACSVRSCPAGYVRGDLVGGCCNDCVPDPLYCRDAADCVIADKPRSCCGCAEPISTRLYEADACWSQPSLPRDIPKACYPSFVCDALCAPCPPPGKPACQEHRCVQVVQN